MPPPGQKCSSSNSLTKSHGNTKFGMQVGIHQNFFRKSTLSWWRNYFSKIWLWRHGFKIFFKKTSFLWYFEKRRHFCDILKKDVLVSKKDVIFVIFWKKTSWFWKKTSFLEWRLRPGVTNWFAVAGHFVNYNWSNGPHNILFIQWKLLITKNETVQPQGQQTSNNQRNWLNTLPNLVL